MTRFKIRNLDREGCIAHVALDTTYDRGVVVDTEQTTPHLITGKLQPTTVFRGSIPYLRDQERNPNAVR